MAERPAIAPSISSRGYVDQGEPHGFAFVIGAGDDVRAQALLIAHPAVRSAARTPEGIRVALRPGFPMTVEDAADDLRRFLVEAGLPVERVEPARAPLEERLSERDMS